MDKNYIGWANFLTPMIMKNDERPELTRELNESFCSTDPVIARQFAEVTFLSDNRSDLPRLTVPTLVLQCTDDAIAPQGVGRVRGGCRSTGNVPPAGRPSATVRT